MGKAFIIKLAEDREVAEIGIALRSAGIPYIEIIKY